MMSKDFVFLTVSTKENGGIFVHDQDGRVVDGVVEIETSVDLETPRMAKISFYCKDSDGRFIPPTGITV